MKTCRPSVSHHAFRMFLCVVIALALFATTSASAGEGRGRHKQLYVVPTPGEVTVDGDLGDWDLSGQIEIFVEEATRGTQNAKIAMMYDDEALYFGGEVHDPNPMMNRHDPDANAARAWDADAIQFRLTVDPDSNYPLKESAFTYRGKDAPEDTRDDIVHLLMWYYTDEGTANLQMQLGMGFRMPDKDWKDGVVPNGKYEGKYKKWDDGLGYNFEYRVPWETLGAEEPPEAGDVVAGTANVLWSRPDGLATGGGSSWAYDIMHEPGFPWQQASCWGKLIFHEEGDVPQELVTAGLPPSRPLPLKFRYELPDDGWTTIQLVADDGEVSRIIVPEQERPGGVNTERWDGMDNHGEVDGHGGLLPAGEYRWKGIFSKKGVHLKYRFSVHNTGKPPYRTPDQTGGWGGDHGTPQTVIALGDTMFCSWNASEAGWGIIRTKLNGGKQWGSSSNARYMATDGERLYYSNGRQVKMLDVAEPRPLSLDNGVSRLTPPPGGDAEANGVRGLAYDNNTVFVAYGERDLIGVYDGTDGSLKDSWKVDSPGRMAIRPDGSLAVITGDRVVSISDGKVEAWLSTNLDAPVGIAVDAQGTAYVSNQGQLQNVSVFNADGQYVKSIGRKGGRPAMGRYDPQGMYQPGGIALDARGRLWVAENSTCPKRISVWKVETGKNADEFFGASSYFAYGYIDPANPDEIYAHNVLWEINWDDYTTEPKTTVWRASEPNMAPAPNFDAHTSGGGFRMVTTDKGRQFGWGGAGGSRGKVFYMRRDDLFQPFAGVINPWKDSGRFPGLQEYKAKLNKQWDENRVAGHRRPRNQFWMDANGDGKVQADELKPWEGVGRPVWMDESLTILTTSGHLLRPTRIKDNGQPVYDIDVAETTPWVGKDLFGGYTIQDPEGAAYTLRHRNGPALIKWSPEGEMEWYYSDLIRWHGALGLPTAGSGRLWGMTRPMGVAGDYIAYQTYFGVNHLFRRDGMYIGALLKAGGAAKQPYQGQNEGQGGAFIKLNIDGEDRYFVIHGSHDVRVWEVMGLDTLQDLPGGTYRHTEKKVARAKQAYQQYLNELEGVQPIEIVRGRDALEEAAAVGKDDPESNRGFEARMAYDAENLYVRYDVDSSHELVNGQGDPQIIFRGGNLIDIQLATNPSAKPDREKPAPGDVRLLVTRKDGKPYAVLFRPRVKGFDGERIVLESPTGEEPFDAIEVVDVGLDYEKTPGGFTAVVTVPLDVLGFNPKPGQKISYDLGYIFGNEKGTRAFERLYVNNNSFTANVVDDIPHESRLEPNQWGEGEVK